MVSTSLILIPYPPSLSAREEDETFSFHNLQLQAMLKRFAHSLGRVELSTDKDQRSKSQVKKGSSKSQGRGTKVKVSLDIRLRSNDFVVRIVHKGGQQEVYQHALPASNVIQKYPGMCVALPEVFRDPHQSVLEPEEVLLLGHKYIIISPRDVEKLKRKHPQQGNEKEYNRVVTQEPSEEKATNSPSGHKSKENGKIYSVPNGVQGQEMVETRTSLSPNGYKVHEDSKEGLGELPGGGAVEESYGYAKEYFSGPKDKSTTYTRRRRGIRGNKPFVPPLPKTRLYRGLEWQPRLPTVQEISP